MPPPPPQLMDDLVEEILLRLPPGSPASLAHAGLLCKRWCHLVSDPGFQRRFRKFHRSHPTLGILETHIDRYDDAWGTIFVPEPGSGLRHAGLPELILRECRHGHVLLYKTYEHERPYSFDLKLVVWNPITGKKVQLPRPPPPLNRRNWTFAVFCAATPNGTCDHLHCHGGPFTVVLVVVGSVTAIPIPIVQKLRSSRRSLSYYVYSSESGAWSEPPTPLHSSYGIGWPDSTLLVGNGVMFMSEHRVRYKSFVTPVLSRPHVQMNDQERVPQVLLGGQDSSI